MYPRMEKTIMPNAPLYIYANLGLQIFRKKIEYYKIGAFSFSVASLFLIMTTYIYGPLDTS
jgi:hypothetical protein